MVALGFRYIYRYIYVYITTTIEPIYIYTERERERQRERGFKRFVQGFRISTLGSGFEIATQINAVDRLLAVGPDMFSQVRAPWTP